MASNSGNNQKPSIIYWIIDSKSRWYVGKWNDNSFDFMKRYHLNNAYPWINFTEAQYKWEKEWNKSLKQNGFQNDTFIYQINSLDINTVANSIKDSLNSFTDQKFVIDNIKYTLFDALKTFWDQDDLEVVEAICILLATKNGSLNTQIDFLTHKNSYLTAADINSYISKDAIINRFKNARFGWFNVGFRNLKNYSEQDFSDEIDGVIQVLISKFTGPDKKSIHMNRSDVRTILEAVSRVASTTTIKHMNTTINNIMNKFHGRGSTEIKKQLREFQKNLKSYENKKAGDLYKAFYDCLDKAKSSFEVNMKIDRYIKTAELLANSLQQWFSTNNIEQFLTGGKNWDYKKELTYEYKKNLANFIQDNIFKPIQSKGDIEGFHKWQIEKREKKEQVDFGGHSYQWFYIKYASIELNQDLAPLSKQALDRIESYGLSFYENNWSKMYREQVSLWLNNEDGSNDITTYKNFSHRFLQLQTPEEITIY